MKFAKTLGLGMLLAALAGGGCSPQGATKPSEKAKDATKDSGAAKDAGAAKDSAKTEDHAPHGTGPNGGVIFDLGKHHAEFTVDHPKKECTILILGDDEKTLTPVAAKELTLSIKETKTKEGKVVAPMTITMLPKDEAGGKASKFVGSDPGIGNVADFEGTVLGEIDGKPSQGEFKE